MAPRREGNEIETSFCVKTFTKLCHINFFFNQPRALAYHVRRRRVGLLSPSWASQRALARSPTWSLIIVFLFFYLNIFYQKPHKSIDVLLFLQLTNHHSIAFNQTSFSFLITDSFYSRFFIVRNPQQFLDSLQQIFYSSEATIIFLTGTIQPNTTASCT